VTDTEIIDTSSSDAGNADSVTAAGEVHTGAMIALVPSAADAQRIAMDGGEEPTELHITLCYLGEAALIPPEVRKALVDDVTVWLDELPTITGKIFSVNLFNPATDQAIVAGAGPEPCVVWGVSGELIEHVQMLVAKSTRQLITSFGMTMHEQHKPWVAHITAAYVAPDDEVDLSAFADAVGPLTFDRVRFAFGGEVTDVPLGEWNHGDDDAVVASDFDDRTDVALKFDPQQPRDSNGRWINVKHGIGAIADAIGEIDVHADAKRRLDGAQSDRSALRAAPHPPRVAEAGAAMYYGDDYRSIQGTMRRGEPANVRTRRAIDSLHAGFGSAKTQEDIRVYRGAFYGSMVFGHEAWRMDNMSGVTFRDPGFASTTANEDIAKKFASKYTDEGVLMRVLVPKDTPAMKLSSWDDEAEVLLNSGMSYRVIADHGTTDNVRHIDVEVIQ